MQDSDRTTTRHAECFPWARRLFRPTFVTRPTAFVECFRRPTASAYSTVLVGIDPSHPAYRTVEQAADIAKKHGSRLAIVCSYFPEPAERVNEAQDILRDAAFIVCGSNLLMVKAADLLVTEDRIPNPRTQKPTGPSAVLRRRARLLTSSS